MASNHGAFDTRIFVKECKTLADAGYDVTFIAPHAHDEVLNGVTVRAIPIPKGRAERMLVTTWRVFRAAQTERADVYHFHDPEMLFYAFTLSLMGHKVIYDVHEDVPRQVLNKRWIPAWLRRPISRFVEWVETQFSQRFAHVIGATDTICQRFPKEKTTLVRNFPILEELSTANGPQYDLRPMSIIYIGMLMHTRGIVEMIEAINDVKPPGAHLILGGEFQPPTLHDEIKLMPGYSRTHFQGWLTRQQVSEKLGSARIGLVVLHPTPSYVDALPVKLFEYMAAGIPVIASDFPGWREIVEGAECGLVVNPMDSAELKTAIEWLLSNPAEAKAMGEKGQAAVETMYNWSSESARIAAAYEEVLAT